jgi:hypothetical protein
MLEDRVRIISKDIRVNADAGIKFDVIKNKCFSDWTEIPRNNIIVAGDAFVTGLASWS